MAVQMQILGGKNSQFHELAIKYPETNCHSWRTEFKVCAIMDVFYDTKSDEAVSFVKEYTKTNDSCIGKSDLPQQYTFCEKDLRMLWGSFAKHDDKDGGACLDTVWEKYFDSKAKYEKLIEIKR